LRAYQKRLAEIQSLGGSVIAISPQLPDKSLSTVEKDELQFEVLSDVGQSVARQFGLVFPVAEVLRPIYKNIGADLPAYNGNESWELPMPGTFVVAKDGTIKLAFVDADYTHRLEPEAIIQSLRTLAKA
jgi:peroxiredoxin